MMAQFVRDLAPLDLKFSEAALLMQVEANPKMTQSELGRVLDIQRANMAPMTARLTERGLIIRAAVDRRSHGLMLSDAGKQLCKSVKAVVARHEAALMARIPHEHRAHFLPALAALWQDEADG